MATNLYGVTRDMLTRICDDFANKAVEVAKGNAPVAMYNGGRLRDSIHVISQGIGRYRVTTAANGDNGFPYPARVEAGDWVYPSASNKRGAIYFYGSWHLCAAPSTRSHFMEDTVSSLHI